MTCGGLGSVYSICDKWKGDGKLCEVEFLDSFWIFSDWKTLQPVFAYNFEQNYFKIGGMDSDSVASAMVQFDGYLSQPDGHNLPQFSLLSSPIIRDKIIKKVFSINVNVVSY